MYYITKLLIFQHISLIKNYDSLFYYCEIRFVHSPRYCTKNKRRMYPILRLFFIQVADLAYHQPFGAGYHLAFGEYIITEGAFSAT